jgi:tRNA(Ile)-lysidine synthase
MFPVGGRVLVALSGGPDSVALTLLLRELAARGECRLVGLAHLNHLLRDGAEADERFCREFAAALALPFHSERIVVRQLAREWRRSVEDAARRARYDFFRRVIEATGADVVATGHTRDDQAETFLLRLLRGSGTRGLAAILPVAGQVVRPVLDIARDELRAYLTEAAQPFREDETNLDMSIPRNRVRHELMPYLRREFSPAIREVLAHEAELARPDEDRLLNEAIDSAGLIVLRHSSGRTTQLTPAHVRTCPPTAWAKEDIEAVVIDAAGLASLHPALASRVARVALLILAPDRFVGFEHVAALLALAAAPSGAVSLPGQQATREPSRIALVRQPFRAFANAFRFPLSIPGEVTLDAQGWAVSAQLGDGVESCRRDNGESAQVLGAAVQASRVALPLSVRSRERGDRLKPLGLGGRTKKLQDFLVDRKVAREQRDSVPLVVDSAGRIVWVVGHPVAEDFRVTEPSQGVILLKARRLGGQG